MDDEEIEYTLFNKRECSVYQIPPASSASGHKADDWKQCIWQGRIRIVGKGKDLAIKLLDANNGTLFAQCSIPGGDHAKYVERVVDSSRYFVLKVQKGTRHAFLGLGFEDRNDSFDFNCTLNEFKTTWIDRENLINAPPSEHIPSKDLSLKEGQKITINFKGLSGESTRKREQTSEVGGPINILAPPPPSGGSRRVAAAAKAPAPAVSAPAAPPLQAAQPVASQADFGDFADFQSADFETSGFQAAPAAAPVAAVPVTAAPAAAPAGSAAMECGGAGAATTFRQMPLGGYNPAPAAMALAPSPFAFDPFADTGSTAAGASQVPAQQFTPFMPAKAATAKKSADPFDEFDIFR